MLPTAATLTISGALIGGAGALVQFGTPDAGCIHLSRAAFDAIAESGAAVVDVRYEVLVADAT